MTRSTSTMLAVWALSSSVGGRQSHDIVVQALQVLLNLEHRGATGSETAETAPAYFYRSRMVSLQTNASE